jgi:hypothetical protein
MPELIDRDKFEKALSEALAKILAQARKNLVQALYHEGFTQGELANIPPDVMRDLEQDLKRELQQQIPPVFVEVATEYAGLLSFALDESRLQELAQTWASSFIPDLVSGMLTTTTTELQRIAQTAPDVELSRRILLGMLGTVALFGLARAITVARTTATEVNSAAEDAVNDELRQSDTVVSIREVIYTKRDERVCPICLPLHGQDVTDATGKPPFHPRCRCERKYEITYSDGTVVIVRSSEEAGSPISVQ